MALSIEVEVAGNVYHGQRDAIVGTVRTRPGSQHLSYVDPKAVWMISNFKVLFPCSEYL